MSRPNINTPNSDLVSSLSQSQSYLSPNFLVILPGLTSSVRLCGVERCPAQQSEEEEEGLGQCFIQQRWSGNPKLARTIPFI